MTDSTTRRLMAALTVALVALVAAGAGTASAEDLNLSDGAVSANATINTTDGETQIDFTSTSTPEYADSLSDRWPFDGTPPENVMDGPNGAIVESANLTVESSAYGSAYNFSNSSHVNITSGVDLPDDGWTVSTWTQHDYQTTESLSGEAQNVLMAQGGYAADASMVLCILQDGASGNDGDGDTDDLQLTVRSTSGETKIQALNVSALQNDSLAHVTAWYNGTHAAIYVNGTREAIAQASFSENSDVATIGGGNLADYPWHLQDETRVYDAALTESEIGEVYNETGEPAKLSHYFPDGGFVSPNFSVDTESIVAMHFATINGATVDVYVERNDSGTWRVDNSTEGITEAGWINLTTSGFYSQNRRVRVNWTATQDADSTLDRILGGGDSDDALWVIPILLIPVTPEMAGFGVVAALLVSLGVVLWWRRQ